VKQFFLGVTPLTAAESILLSQIIIGKELSGEEAVKGMERLKRIIKQRMICISI